jgi:hypothetical protein
MMTDGLQYRERNGRVCEYDDYEHLPYPSPARYTGCLIPDLDSIRQMWNNAVRYGPPDYKIKPATHSDYCVCWECEKCLD